MRFLIFLILAQLPQIIFAIHFEGYCKTEVVEKEVGIWEDGAILSYLNDTPACTFNYTKDLQKRLSEFSTNLIAPRVNITIKLTSPKPAVWFYSGRLIVAIRQHYLYRTISLPQPVGYDKVMNESGWYRQPLYEAGWTLCLDPAIGTGEVLLVVIEMSGGGGMNFSIRVDVLPGINIVLSDEMKLENTNMILGRIQTLTPAISTYYLFNFSSPENRGVKNVSIITRSMGNSRPCVQIGVQSSQCPVFDTEETIDYQRMSQTMLNLSVIHISQYQVVNGKSLYRDGFIIVALVLDEDERCRSEYLYKGLFSNVKDRNATLDIAVVPSPWDKRSPNRTWTWLFPFPVIWLLFTITLLISVSILTSLKLLKCARDGEIVPGMARKTPIRIIGSTDDGQDIGYLAETSVSDFVLAGSHYYSDFYKYFAETKTAGVQFFMGASSLILLRIMTLTVSSDLTECSYNQLCSYQMELKFTKNTKFKFFMWNSFVSSFCFTICGLVFLLFLLIRMQILKRIDQERAMVFRRQVDPAIFHNVLDRASCGDDNGRSSEATIPVDFTPPLGPDKLDIHLHNINVQGLKEVVVPESDSTPNGLAENHQVSVTGDECWDGPPDPSQEDKNAKAATPVPESFGIPHNLGIEKALAFLLALQGLVSSMYHVCPNVGSYQIEAPIFDLVTILGWVKVHHLRRTSYITPGRAAKIAFIFGVFEQLFSVTKLSHDQSSAFFVPVCVLFYLYCGGLQVLHVLLLCSHGHFWILAPQSSNECGKDQPERKLLKLLPNLKCIKQMLKPRVPPQQNFWMTEQRIVVFIGMVNVIAAFALFIFVYVHQVLRFTEDMIEPNRIRDLSETIMEIAMINIIVILAVHFGKKFYYEGHKHYLTLLAPMTCYFAFVTFYILQFIYKEKGDLFDWSLSTAESQNLNEPCIDGVYDAHDYYHFYKSISLFAMCMTLATIDDGCVLMKQKSIRVF